MDIQFLLDLESNESVFQDRLRSCRMDRIKKLALFVIGSLSLFVLSSLNSVYIMRSSPRLAPLLVMGNAVATTDLYRRIVYPFVAKIQACKKEESRLKKILDHSELSIKELDANSALSPFCQKIFQQILYKVREKTLVLKNRMSTQPDLPFFESTIQKYHLLALKFYAIKAIENRADRLRMSVEIEPFFKSFGHLVRENNFFVDPIQSRECFPLRFDRLPNNYRNLSVQTERVRMSLIDFISAQNYPEKIQEALARFR
jgi:hypothetical protein